MLTWSPGPGHLAHADLGHLAHADLGHLAHADLVTWLMLLYHASLLERRVFWLLD